jgi:signal transduction histidine kinase
MLENLLGNAAEHGDSGVRVEVGGLDGGFYVADDGPGFEGVDPDRLFEHGYTASDSGTGFGLSIVEGIASAHGWTVTATERAEGGARFEVTGVTCA